MEQCVYIYIYTVLKGFPTLPYPNSVPQTLCIVHLQPSAPIFSACTTPGCKTHGLSPRRRLPRRPHPRRLQNPPPLQHPLRLDTLNLHAHPFRPRGRYRRPTHNSRASFHPRRLDHCHHPCKDPQIYFHHPRPRRPLFRRAHPSATFSLRHHNLHSRYA